MVQIKPVSNRREKKEFLKLPFRILRNFPLWIPPLSNEMKKIIDSKGSSLLANGSHEFFIAVREELVVGRVIVGIEEVMNRVKGVRHAYFTLFECEDNQETADALIDTAALWARERGMSFLKGPVSPTNGDDYRGLLVENFDDPPAVLMPYHPPYYMKFFHGYQIYLKYLAFEYDLRNIISERERKHSAMAMERYGYTVECADFSDIRKTAEEIYNVMIEAMPEWEEDLIAPTFEEIYDAAKTMKLVADSSLVIIARAGGRPIGYFVALPDFSDIIRKIGGRLLPFGWVTFLKDKKHIKRVRAAILFVVPEFRNRGVTVSMFVRAYDNAQKRGYEKIEASSISWMNTTMITNARRFGGRHYKTYMVFGRNLTDEPLSLNDIYGGSAVKFDKNAPLPIFDSGQYSSVISENNRVR